MSSPALRDADVLRGVGSETQAGWPYLCLRVAERRSTPAAGGDGEGVMDLKIVKRFALIVVARFLVYGLLGI